MLDEERLMYGVKELRRIALDMTKNAADVARIADEIEILYLVEDANDKIIREVLTKQAIAVYSQSSNPYTTAISSCLANMLPNDED